MAADIFTEPFPVLKMETFRIVLIRTDYTQSAQVWVRVLEIRSNFSPKLILEN